MIKLTDQRVQELVREAHVAFCENKYQSFELAFADMVQAEVLRLNAPQYEILAAYGTHSVTPGIKFPQHVVQIFQALDPGDVIALIKGGAAHLVTEASPTEDEEAELCENCVTPWKCNGPHVPEPRATGCPDTMDDTARFAADELPAILRPQAPV